MRRRERLLSEAYRRAGAGPDADVAVRRAIRYAIDQLVIAHQSNIDLSGVDRLDAVRRCMLAQCPNTVEDDRLLAALSEGVCARARWEPPRIIEGVEAELDQLRQRGLRLAVVSNTGLAPGRHVERALLQRGFDRWIEHWIWSDEVLSWKPGQAIYRAALRALGVEAARVAFVGDTPEADILGAQQAGFAAAIQVGDKQDDAIQPDFHLSTLAGLASALEGIGFLSLHG